ncbi:MAG: histidine kinase [Erythrobacter sp.]|jgi:signal transduction histidine kinase|uniref:sensor histidine kinase n=1 Tax=Erythrobacter sp. TaxID=1042 RepID=UPI002B46ED62|nr:histidine kinase [Erythrobacter sp.]WRH69621.1 MAG: histidine kinase [Erythrobacter sp.]
MATLSNSEPTATASDATVPFRTVLFSMIVLWATYFALTTMRSMVMDFGLQFELGWRRLLVTAAGVALTLVMWLLLRLFDNRPLWLKISAAIALAMPAALAIGQVNYLVFKDMAPVMEQAYAEKNNLNLRRDESGNLLIDVPIAQKDAAGQGAPGATQSVIIEPAETQADFWRRLLDVALGRYFLLLAWASTYFALLAGVQARSAERREQQFRSAAKAAELRSLRYQVNPHFLFNTLNSLSALVMIGKADRAEKMIQTISRFYRHSLANEPTADVSLSDEFDLQRLYLDIEAVRFPERLVCVFDLPAGLEDARVPGMILQPLVENSVKYAISAVARPVTITIAAREEFDRLVITVSDDGPGVPQGAHHGFGIGLANVRDRLEARFGPDIGFTSAPVPDGYRTEIRIPLTRSTSRHDG